MKKTHTSKSNDVALVGMFIRRVKDKARKDKKIQETSRQEEAKEERDVSKKYNDWKSKNLKEAKRAAVVIWNWYCKFILSKNYEKLKDALKEIYVSNLKISATISCDVPGYGKECQFLFIDSGRNLYVDLCKKYGRTEKISEREDLLEHVCYPILVEIAQTVMNKSILKIIVSDINFR